MQFLREIFSRLSVKLSLIFLGLSLLTFFFLDGIGISGDSAFISGEYITSHIIFIVITSALFFFISDKLLRDKSHSSVNNGDVPKQSQSELLKSKEKAEAANLAKSMFLANMSQEIRTPMNGIVGMADLMSLTKLTTEQKEYLDIIKFSSTTLLAIVNDIMDFSRIEAGKLKLDRVDFNFKDLTEKTCKVLEAEAKKKKLILKLEIETDCEYDIIGDPLRTNQVLLNLVGNAIKFTESGFVEVNISRDKKSSKSRMVYRLRVKDTGVGIAKEHINNVFEAFSLYNNSAKMTYKGKGLGLSIVKNIVGCMGGDVSVTSEVNKGSEFICILPYDLHKEEEKVEAIKPETEAPGTLKDGGKSKFNILVAEDNFVNQRLVKELLRRKGYEVNIVDNGLKLFEEMENKKYDIILMDVQMPVMDGLEATSIIREIEKETGGHIPIIGITAYSMKADRDRCVEAGMDDYLSKPFSKDDFYSKIEKFVLK